MTESDHMFWGLAAGLGVSVCWTSASLCFTAAGKRLGVAVMNALRILIAVMLLGVTHRLLSGQWIPDCRATQVFYLAASGLIGLSIGDQALFTAFVDIGTRRSMLVMTTSPLFAVLFGWIALGETLPGMSWIGVVMTVGGVAWVISERNEADAHPPGHLFRGVGLAVIGAVCQAAGLLLSKVGMGHGWLPEDEHLNPQAATLVRMFFAAIGMAPIVLFHVYRERKRRADGVPELRQRTGSRSAGAIFALCGAVSGPFLGVWLSLIASDRVSVGVAQTTCSLAPVLLLPILAFGLKERISLRACVGAVVSVMGIGVLFWENI